MASIHKRLREAAKAGSELELRALLREPGCDALAQDKFGMTALMHASVWGRESCVGLLLPMSDALTENNNGLTASGLAAYFGHEGLARFIDAYALAQAERAALGVAAGSGAPRGRVSRRM